MSWEILLPDRPNKTAVAPVTVTCSKHGGRFEPRMLVTIRVGAGAQDWCQAGATVKVERGTGHQEGNYRITPAPGGPWRLSRSAGRTPSVTLKLPVPPEAPRGGCRQLPVAFRWAERRLDIELPEWAPDAKAPPRQDYPPPRGAPSRQDYASRATAAAQGQRYVGVSERVPDPAQAIQQANGGRVR